MKTFGFPRSARLKSKKAIDTLFGLSQHSPDKKASATLCYPLRAVWNIPSNRNANEHGIKILVSVPKKRLRLAVDRVATRRLIKEAWRLQRGQLGALDLDLAIIFIGQNKETYSHIYSAISKIISKLRNIETNSSANVP